MIKIPFSIKKKKLSFFFPLKIIWIIFLTFRHGDELDKRRRKLESKRGQNKIIYLKLCIYNCSKI